ncbi:hypothetical protein BDV97DRAFT_352258 [Delphinella strobiligena]|nr:hypothetical protein BDV97DRAFT_352258 [Delphinella strobiligena]
MSVRKPVKRTTKKPTTPSRPSYNIRRILEETEDQYRVDWEPSWEYKKDISDADAESGMRTRRCAFQAQSTTSTTTTSGAFFASTRTSTS